MGQGEVCLEIVPNISGVGLALIGFAIVQKHPGCEEELKGSGNNLGGGIGIILDGSIVNGVFDLVEKAFDWLVGIVCGLESYVVVLEVGCRDASVLYIKMLRDVAHGYI